MERFYFSQELVKTPKAKCVELASVTITITATPSRAARVAILRVAILRAAILTLAAPDVVTATTTDATEAADALRSAVSSVALVVVLLVEDAKLNEYWLLPQ